MTSVRHIAGVLVLGLCLCLTSSRLYPQTAVSITFQSPSLLASGSLSSAQILTLNTVPVEVIPAPGAGNTIIVESFTAQLVAGGTPYSGTGTLTLITSGGNLITSGTGCVAAFLTAAANNFCNPTLAGVTASASTNWVNSDAQLKMGNAQDTLGNGTISYWVKYHVLSGF